MEVVSVVAGGWSVTQIDRARIPGYIIAVNDAAKHLPRVDAIVSMDRKWAEGRMPMLQRLQKPTWLRRKTVPRQIREAKPDWLELFDNDHTSVYFVQKKENRPWTLNGTNSGVCGLALAFALKPRQLYLFGFDMCAGPKGEPHWYPMYEWRGERPKGTPPSRMAQWRDEFPLIARQFEANGIKATSVTTRTLITDIPKLHPRDLGLFART